MVKHNPNPNLPLGLIIAALTIPILSPTASARQTTVTVLVGPSISGIEMVKDIVAKWDQKKTDIKIKVDVAPPTSPAEVLMPRAAAGVLPDLYFDMPLAPMAAFQKSKLLYQWDRFPDYWKVLEKRGTREFAKDLLQEGKSYLLPWQVETNAMIWNYDLLKKVGLGTAPKNYSDFFRTGEKLKGQSIALMSLNSPGSWDSRIGDFYNTYLAASNGRTLLKGGKPDINNPVAKQVLQMFVDAKKKDFILKPTPEDAFSSQKLAMKYTGPGDKEYLDKLKFDWQGTHWIVPDDYSGSNPPYVYANLKGIVMFEDSKNKDEAWEFVKYFISIQGDMVTLSYGRMPVRDTLAEDPDFDSWWQRYPKYKVYASQMKRMKGLDMAPKVERMMEAVDQEFTAAVDQKKTVKEALAALEKKILQIIGMK